MGMLVLGPLASGAPGPPSFCFTAPTGSHKEAHCIHFSLQTAPWNLTPFSPSLMPFVSASPPMLLLFPCFSVTLHLLPTLSKPLLSTYCVPGIMQGPEESEPQRWW